MLGTARAGHNMSQGYWEQGQDIAEYAVMLVVILVIVIGTVKLIGSKRSDPTSQTDSSLRR